MQSLISFFGGAGLAYLISDILKSFDSHKSRSQHQQDVTVTEIRKFKEAIRKKNRILLSHRTNINQIAIVKVNIVSYISSWSVNVIFDRINKRMTIYSLKSVLKLEYQLVHRTIAKCLIDPNVSEYYDIALKAKRLFKVCGII